jgi:DNA ligase-1
VVILQRLTGPWQPSPDAWRRLVAADTADEDRSRPYPFFLASPLDHAADAATVAAQLGEREQWLVEWKWDGIRAQLVRRDSPELWSRGEELVTGRFPEIALAAAFLPAGTVLDGELLAWNDAGVMPFAALQRRLGRKRLPAPLLAEVPVVFLAYDLLEDAGADRRGDALDARRADLERRLEGAPAALRLSPRVQAQDWPALERLRGESRARGVEGFMLKRRDSAYGAGRQRGAWWKWKIAPWTVDAVLVYAQPGHGRRASLYTDYTFAVSRDDELVPVAKAYSGLEDAEITELDRWIRRHTVERFGPVRSVEAAQVFELAFEGIAASSRHKSGLALRFPRIARWRRDLGPRDADRLASLEAVLESAGA